MLASGTESVRARRTSRFDRDPAGAPPAIQRAFEKQLRLLLENRRHPSLRAKKYDEARGVWQGRVTRSWRFYFTIAADTYTLLTMHEHLLGVGLGVPIALYLIDRCISNATSGQKRGRQLGAHDERA